MPAVIRFAEEADAPGVQAIYAPFCDATTISFELAAPSVDEMANRIRTISERFPWLICEHDGVIAGYAYAGCHRERFAYRWSVDVTVYNRHGYRRVGIGRALYTSLFRLLVLQGYFKAYAGITLPNPASEGLHQALGFEPVGVYHGVGYKMGGWHDVVWLQKSLQPETSEPAPPRPFPEIRDSAAAREALVAGVAPLRVP